MRTTKDEICDTAVRLFRERGYDSVRVIDICDELGVTKGSFFHHFGSKSDVLHHWFVSWQRQMVTSSMELGDGLWPFLRRYTEGVSSLGPDLLFHMTVSNASLRSVGIERTVEEISDAFATANELIAREQEAGTITRQVPPNVLVRTYNLAFTGLIVEWYEADGSFDFVERVHELYQVVFRA